MASKNTISGPVKAPLGSYPKLWRLLDHYFLKEDVPDRAALQALDTLVDLNQAVLDRPKSVNNRAIRSSDPKVRNLVETGGTDILTEVGWVFKVMRMEECWVLPYDADLEVLQVQQDKIIETRGKLRERFTKSLAATTGRAEKERSEKLAIVRQIEQDKAEREHRNALRTGALLKPTQSLDEMRKQAVRERMERDKARKAAGTTPAPRAEVRGPLPGTFPTETRTTSASKQEDDDDRDDDSNDDDNDDEVDDNDGYEEYTSDEGQSAPPKTRVGGPTGGRSPQVTRQSGQRRRTGTVPIPVTKPVVKERYTATENRLGGSSAAGGEETSTYHDDDDNDESLP